jgi:transketolase
VLYAPRIRPFDGATLRQTLAAPNVVLVEPYLAGTSAGEVADVLVDVPHRLLSLGVRDVEMRKYGQPEERHAAHGLDVPGLRKSITDFLGR